MPTESSKRKNLVLVGGGHTHALVLRRWASHPISGVHCTLINPGPYAPYSGMLPGYIAGHYKREDLDIDLVRLARMAGAEIVLTKAIGLDREAKLVHLGGLPPLAYDLVAIDIGATAKLHGIPGYAEHAHSVKPLGPFAIAWQAFIDQRAEDPKPAQCAVVGGGIAGVELALAMAHRMKQSGLVDAGVTLIEGGDKILSHTSPSARRILLKACTRFKVEVLTRVQMTGVSENTLHLSNGQTLPANFVVSAAGARAYPWIASTGLQHTNGFIDVGADLRSVNDGKVFAVGDCAHLTHDPRPKAGVFAVRQAPVLLNNIRASFEGTPLKAFDPQSDYLKLISTGGRSAVGQKHWVTLSGPLLWSLKDRIDRDFMQRLRE